MSYLLFTLDIHLCEIPFLNENRAGFSSNMKISFEERTCFTPIKLLNIFAVTVFDITTIKIRI